MTTLHSQHSERKRRLRPASNGVIGSRGRAIVLSVTLAMSVAIVPASAQSLTPGEINDATKSMGVSPKPQHSGQGSQTASGQAAKTAVQATFSTAVGLHPVSQHQPGVHWKNPPSYRDSSGVTRGLSPAGAVVWIVATTVVSTFVGPTIADGLGDGWLAKASVSAATAGGSAILVPGAAVPAAVGGFISSAVDSAIDNSGCPAGLKPWAKSAAAGLTAGCVAAATAGSAAPLLPVAGVVAAGTLAINKTQQLIDAFSKPNDPSWDKQDQASQPPGNPIGDTGTMNPGDGTGQDLATGIAKDLALSSPGSTSRGPSAPPRTGQPDWTDPLYPPEPGVIIIPVPGGWGPGHPGGGSGMGGPGGHSHDPATGADMPHSKKPGGAVTPKPIPAAVPKALTPTSLHSRVVPAGAGAGAGTASSATGLQSRTVPAGALQSPTGLGAPRPLGAGSAGGAGGSSGGTTLQPRGVASAPTGASAVTTSPAGGNAARSAPAARTPRATTPAAARRAAVTSRPAVQRTHVARPAMQRQQVARPAMQRQQVMQRQAPVMRQAPAVRPAAMPRGRR
jgi:hypothetical protein